MVSAIGFVPSQIDMEAVYVRNINILNNTFSIKNQSQYQ